ncbi:hypothetical protein NQ314_013929 [Rhamnusium bicolor]|uniref:Transposase n=1 Tax=Rhamnusium bicolor TaxID=1586634 RepID=A0AAV8X456_9CUCU|nr:hypothetical protein NQ314_013929 [Rhamnusium bicolor]
MCSITSTYKKHEVDVISKAIAPNAKGLSIRKAAVQFKIPYTVLQRRIKNPTSVKKQGGQTVLTAIEEDAIVKKLQVCAEWGYLLDLHGLRLIIKLYLDRLGKTVARFKDNMPGTFQRHIINYDATNLSNDPGRCKIIAKRGCKYPERVINQTKSAVSIMFAATGDGKMLPCYVVYKPKNIYSTWVEGGSKYTRYNATLSGWFDNVIFTYWLKAVAITHLQRLDGDKVLIGDNLSSHLSEEVISHCTQHKNPTVESEIVPIENVVDSEAEEDAKEMSKWAHEDILLLIHLYKKYKKLFESGIKKKVWQKITNEINVMDEILGLRPEISPQVVASSSSGVIKHSQPVNSTIDEATEPSTSNTNSTPRSTRNKRDYEDSSEQEDDRAKNFF